MCSRLTNTHRMANEWTEKRKQTERERKEVLVELMEAPTKLIWAMHDAIQ